MKLRLTENIALLLILKIIILHHLNLDLLKLPLQAIRQLFTRLLVPVLGVPEPLFCAGRDEGYLAIHEVEDGGATLFTVDADSDFVCPVVESDGKDHRGYIVVLQVISEGEGDSL